MNNFDKFSKINKFTIIKLIITLFLSINTIGCKLDYINNNNQSMHQQHEVIWSRLRMQFKLNHYPDNSRVKYYITRYQKQVDNLATISERATPYLFYIMEELEKRNLPGELAILPMIESAYSPFATSNVGASGLWQLTRGTAARYGIRTHTMHITGYDGRRDLVASTNAALNYLEFLNQEFNNDWLLTFAAYNAGEGRVQNAIKQAKKRGFTNPEFWHLKLPQQTRDFVPKLLAIAVLLNDYKFEQFLPDVPNKPFLKHIQLDKPLRLNNIAALAEISLNELLPLNAGFGKVSGAAHYSVLLPIPSAHILERKLEQN